MENNTIERDLIKIELEGYKMENVWMNKPIKISYCKVTRQKQR